MPQFMDQIPWDPRVLSAVEQVEELPGFSPDRIGFGMLRYEFTDARGPMQKAVIYAHAPAAYWSGLVRFAMRNKHLTASEVGQGVLSNEGLARALDVPVESARGAKAILSPALGVALTSYNALHARRLKLQADPTQSLAWNVRRHDVPDQAGPRSLGL